MREVRVDAVASLVCEVVSQETMRGREVTHHSIPAFDETGGPIRELGDEIGSAKTRVTGGEVLISKLNPRKPRVQIVGGVAPDELAVCSGEFVVLKPQTINARYLHYAMLSDGFRQRLAARVQSVTRSQQRVSPDDIAHAWFAAPDSRWDQEHIADFLDAESARIDALIIAKQKQRDLARERYASWRRGLFSSIAGMRPLGLTARVLRGTTFPDRYQGNPAGDLPFIKVADFSRRGNTTVVRGADNWITSSVARELKATVIPRDAVIFPRVGMAMMSNPRRIAGLDLVMDDNQLALVLTEPGEPRYLFQWMLTVDLVAESNPGTVPSVTDSSLRRLRIPWPSRHEQRHIADTLDREATRVSEIDRALELSINLLRERRQALITAAVTGRLQVPGTLAANAAA